jgi:hypothetical protein
MAGIVFRGRPDAGPAGTPIDADTDQIKGLLAFSGLGCGGVLKEHERGPVTADERGPDLPGGLADGPGQAGFGNDGQAARRSGVPVTIDP